MAKRYEHVCASLRRAIERREWQDLSLEPGHHSSCPVKHIEDEQERYEGYLTESLLTGLETRDPLIALRCFGQVRAYREKLPNRGGPALSDAAIDLQNRLENMLSIARDVLKPLCDAGEV